MKKVLFATLLLVLVACQADDGQIITATDPFIGGTQGLVFDFQDFRSEVFDASSDPFDMVVRIENKGETLVEKNNIQVKLSGFNPLLFNKGASELIKNAPDDIIEARKDPQGGIIPGPQVFTEFTDFNYAEQVTGAANQFPVRAEVCYLYRTKAASKLCVRRNLLTPRAGGICEINEQKQLFNSGAPVQIQNFKESTRARDKIGFTFEVVNVGQGDVFERNTMCDRVDRRKENRAYVVVTTGLSNVQCTGLESTNDGAEGFITLFGGSKIVSCTQRVESPGDFEQPVTLEVVYDYEERIQTTLTVKTTGQE